MLEIKGLSKSYDGNKVVTDVNLTLPEKSVISLIGPNGAGKSTVLNMIARLSSIDSGEVMFKGRDVRKWQRSELARFMAILTQHNNIQSKLTVRELISFGRFPGHRVGLPPMMKSWLIRLWTLWSSTNLPDDFLMNFQAVSASAP